MTGNPKLALDKQEGNVQNENMLKKIINYSIIGLVFFLPLFFLPLTIDFYFLPKNFLLIFFSVTLFCLFFSHKFISRDLKFSFSNLDIAVFLFCLTNILSTFISSPNKVESVLIPGGTGTILALTLLYFVVKNLQPPTYNLQLTLLTSASVLALLALYQFFGIGEAIAPYQWMKPRFWTPAGGLLPLATFLLVGLAIGLTKFRQKEASSQFSKLLLLTAILLILLGLGTSLYQLLGSQKPVLLPYSIGWQIGVEGFKNLKTALFGVGPGNFVSAFTSFKPIGFNRSSFWNFRFASSSNFYFQLLTEVGLLGLASFLFIVFKILAQKDTPTLIRCPLYLILFLFLFLPSNLLLLFIFFVLLGRFGLEKIGPRKEEELKTYLGEEMEEKFKSLTLLPLLFEVIFLFFFGKAVFAEVLYKRALDKLVEGKGGEAYNLLISAISKNPYRENFRVSYSQVNLALANNIANKEKLTEQDRTTITQLVQQAIREGKAAVALNPLNVGNWENLARIYRNLVNVAQGADAWAAASYNQAIFLDPLNPILRIDFGGLYYSLRNFDQAERIFEQAINLKPDFANAHYNLAAALREKGEFARAAREMEITLSLVEPESNDFKKASAELKELQAKIPAEEKLASPAGQLETLSPPATAPAGLKPPIKLGKEAKPEITPSPKPEISPSPTTTPTP